MKRKIQDILYFREDISPFLIHLTRGAFGSTAKQNLEKIIREKKLACGNGSVSDARFGVNTSGMSEAEKREFFAAVCLTETPLSEIHCLLEVDERQVNLAPYGLAFLKEKIVSGCHLSPVHYFNNNGGDTNGVMQALCSLNKTHRIEARKALPLISVFGQRITAPNASPQTKEVNFLWEREWRLPSIYGDLNFSIDDLFVGLCPDDEIDQFEKLFPGLSFIDPHRNIKWYASKLVEARQRVGMKYSVV